MTQFHFEGHSLLGFKISEICTIGQIHSQFTSQGHLKVKDIVEKETQSFRSLALIRHTERENLLKTPCTLYIDEKRNSR